MERKLAAIFSTDVKGYSRLMGEDEAATIHTLTAYREVMATLIQQHRGRVVDSPGDNLLAEFTSVVEAVQCAVAIQHELHARNAELPPQRRMEFRIGINLGDVIAVDERLYGDSVNIAARLEGLAEAGGICISGTVYDHIEARLPLRYEALGEQAVKNIARPVRVYRVPLEPIRIKLSIDSFRQYDRFVLFPQTILQDLRCCLSFSQCFGCQTFSSGTDTCEKTAQYELGLKDGLHPTFCKGLEMAQEFQQTQLTLSLHPETSPHMWTECIIEQSEQHATIE
jgi:class 3 adenylate cyclase